MTRAEYREYLGRRHDRLLTEYRHAEDDLREARYRVRELDDEIEQIEAALAQLDGTEAAS
jgi:hypothetical protein